jgi:hypothetical protein
MAQSRRILENARAHALGISPAGLCAAPDLIAQGYVKRIADRTFIITDKPWRDD